MFKVNGLMQKRALLAVGLFLCLGLDAAAAADPSFDCDKAKADVEKLICADDELAAMDVKLAKKFANALANASADAVSDLKAAHKSWRRDLINCGKSDNARSCAANAYSERLSQL